jgi:hypothetical protein
MRCSHDCYEIKFAKVLLSSLGQNGFSFGCLKIYFFLLLLSLLFSKKPAGGVSVVQNAARRLLYS